MLGPLLLMYGFLFTHNPTVFVLDKNCDVLYHRSAPAIKIEPMGVIKLIYGPNSVEGLVLDRTVGEVHVLEKGRYTFFQYSRHHLHRVSVPNCNL